MEALALLQALPPPPTGWERAGIVTILVAALFFGALAFYREWIVPGSRALRDREAAMAVIDDLKEENREQNAQIVRLASDMVRLNDQYQQTMRELASAGMGRRDER